MGYVDETRWRADPWDDPDVTDALLVERVRRQHRSVKWFVWVLMYLGMAGIVVAGGVGLWYSEKVNPKGDPGAPVNFTVNDDDTVETISERLMEEGLVSEAWVFRWYVDQHGGLELTPGYYQIRPSDHMGNIMRVLGTPPSETYTTVTFPEGFTYERMGERLEERVPRLSAVKFGVASTDGSIRSVWQPPEINSLEGLMFPDTYQVSNGESERQVVQRMVQLMERVGRQEDIETLGPGRVGLTPYQVLIVASLIEREARVPEDRAKIARVIYNRLFLGMPLEIDASLYYGQPDLPFADLKAIDSPYNTYLHTGLPPTPIANPGRASIEAALNPVANPSLGDPLCVGLPDTAPCIYLYYVIADEEGRHVFAVTYEQHLVNVQAARDKGLL